MKKVYEANSGTGNEIQTLFSNRLQGDFLIVRFEKMNEMLIFN